MKNLSKGNLYFYPTLLSSGRGLNTTLNQPLLTPIFAFKLIIKGNNSLLLKNDAVFQHKILFKCLYKLNFIHSLRYFDILVFSYTPTAENPDINIQSKKKQNISHTFTANLH